MKTLMLLMTLTLMTLMCACGCHDADPSWAATYQHSGPAIPANLQADYDAYSAEVMSDPRLAGVKSFEPSGVVWVSTLPPPDGRPNGVTFAVCTFPGRRVYLNEKGTEDFTAPELRALLFHELTHCRYGMDHDPRPKLIFSAGFDPQEVVKDWPKQVDTLIQFIAEHHAY